MTTKSNLSQEHTRFVQAVRYSPNGAYFVSAGFDGKVFLFDGNTSELISEIGSPAHSGGVYGVRLKFSSELNHFTNSQKITSGNFD